MDGRKVLEVVALYQAYFKKRHIPKMDFPHNSSPANYGSQAKDLALAHCHGMLDKIEVFVTQRRLEKAFRWLGFIQGILWVSGCYTLEELKDCNRPNSAV